MSIFKCWPDERKNKAEENLFLNITSGHALRVALFNIFFNAYADVWNKENPDVDKMENVEHLYGVNYDYVILHKQHAKFGNNIIEYGDSGKKNYFGFCDLHYFMNILHWLDETLDMEWPTEAPYIPTYYAFPEDRHYYGTKHQHWKNEENS